jgi:putative ABC transport system permease protein
LLFFRNSGFIRGFFPALYISSFEAQKSLKRNFNRVRLEFGCAMVCWFSIAIAVFFIIGTTIVYQQVNYLTNKNFGFKGDQSY